MKASIFRNRLLQLGSVVSCVLIYLLFRTPTPEYFLNDGDGGVQLAAAQQILLTGEQPWIDFYVPYGPLVFYTSALAQWLSGGRLIGEIVLVIIGYGTAYVLLFYLARRLSASSVIAWITLFCGLAVMPRYYKYWIVLFPMLACAACVWWMVRPSKMRSAICGVVIGVSFLFRADLGVYSGLAVLAALLSAPKHVSSRRLGPLFQVATGASLAVLPWVVLVGTRGSLRDVVMEIWWSAMVAPKGVALPHPLLFFQNPALSALFAVFFVPTLVAAAALGIRWKRLNPLWRTSLLTAVVIALACLNFASQRSDLAHLQQVIPMSLLVASGLVGLVQGARRKWVAFGAMLAAIVASLAIVSIVRKPGAYLLQFGSPGISEMVRSLRLAAMERADLLESVESNRSTRRTLEVLKLVRDRTGTDDRVCFWPFLSQLVYFSERPFGGLTTVLLPGLYDLPRYQQAIIGDLECRPPKVVVWEENFLLDGEEGRMPVKTHAEVHEYIRWRYLRTQEGRFSVYERDDSGD